MKLRSQGPASPVPDMTTARKKPVLKKQADLPLMTRYGLVWPIFDCRGYKAPTTEESVDNFIHHVIILAKQNAIYIPNGVMFTGLCSTGFVYWTWYKQIQAQRVFRLRDLFMHSPDTVTSYRISRAYRSTYELHSRFLFNVLFSGLEWPMMSTLAGMAWILARFFYVKACSAGEPEERYYHWVEYVSFNALRIGALYHGVKNVFNFFE